MRKKTEVNIKDESLIYVHYRDDAFSDSVQRTEAETGSGPYYDDRTSSRNERQAPSDQAAENRFGPALGRWGFI